MMIPFILTERNGSLISEKLQKQTAFISTQTPALINSSDGSLSEGY